MFEELDDDEYYPHQVTVITRTNVDLTQEEYERYKNGEHTFIYNSAELFDPDTTGIVENY